MKIVQSNSERLIVEERPLTSLLLPGAMVLVGGFFLIQLLSRPLSSPVKLLDLSVAGIIVLIGTFLLLVKPWIVVFEFDLRRRELRWSRRGFLVSKSGGIPFKQILGAHVQTGSHRRDVFSSRLVLDTTNGDVPINPGPRPVSNVNEVCAAINHALHDTSVRVEI